MVGLVFFAAGAAVMWLVCALIVRYLPVWWGLGVSLLVAIGGSVFFVGIPAMIGAVALGLRDGSLVETASGMAIWGGMIGGIWSAIKYHRRKRTDRSRA